MDMIIYCLLAIILILLILVIIFTIRLSGQASKRSHIRAMADKIDSGNQTLQGMILQQQKIQQESTYDLSAALKDSFHRMEVELLKNTSEGQLKTQQLIARSLKDIQNTNDQRLAEIQNNVNEKLDQSLNQRLDYSFKQIGDQLQTLYKSLGELQSLSSGVSDLQKTLSNVKTRGIFGEVQLKNILTDIMDSSQYAENIATKSRSSDRVEFAVKIPDKENPDAFIYLPIDSKFPADLYHRIIDAANSTDSENLKLATKELEQRIRSEARTIRDKYIDPPATTDFAIMFLPTEGLYAEVIRIPGLTEWCQNHCKIIISGPTTLVALLNSLSIGFRYLTVNKNAKDILNILSAVKTQYQKFGMLIQKTQKKLQEAQSVADDLQSRNEIIQKRLSRVEVMEEGASARILGMADGEDF